MSKRVETVLYIAEADQMIPYDDQRKGRSSPLPFVKFRTPGDTSADGLRYRQRRQALKALPRGWSMLAIYDELVICYAGDRIAPLRGFVVNHRHDSATIAQIALEIGAFDLGLVKRAIAAMLEIGLLVYVQRPNFEEAISKDASGRTDGVTLARSVRLLDMPPGDGSQRKPETDNAGGASAPAEVSTSPDNTRDASASREGMTRTAAADTPGDGAPPPDEPPDDFRPASGTRPESRGETLRPETSDVQTPDPESPPSASAAPPPPSALGDGKQADKKPTATADADGLALAGSPSRTADPATPDAGTLDAAPDETATEATTAETTTAEPNKPTEADPGRRGMRSTPDMSYCSASFAKQIRKILYPDRAALTEQGLKKIPPQGPDEFKTREESCIAKCFDAVLEHASQVQAFRLLERSIKGAHETFRKKAKETRGRLWVYEFWQYSKQYCGNGGGHA